MKTLIRYFLLLPLVAGLASCSDSLLNDPLEPVDATDSDSYVQEIIVTIPEIVEEGETADTRTTFTFPASGGFSTSWAAGDTIGIFPSSGGQVEFPISGTGSTAQFNGGGWGLKTSYTYAAYYPFSKENYYRNNKTILMDYTGQVQTYNNRHTHLGSYDFLASKPVTPTGGSVNISTDRLGAIMKLELTVPAGLTYTELELISDGTPFVTKAELDISKASPQVTPRETSRSIRLKLDNIKISSGEILTAYMMVYPVGEVNPKVVLHGNGGIDQGTLNKSMNLAAKTKYTRQATVNQGLLITNKKLIAAVESGNNVTFTKTTDGTVNLNNPDNQDLLQEVTSINVDNMNDPTVCDEIGYFKYLKYLHCSNNSLTSLDLSQNLALERLYCSENSLTSLDLSNNKSLVYLDCSMNFQLKNLNMSENRCLERLKCSFTNIKTLDLSNNLNLEVLDCGHNNLSSLDLSQHTRLKNVDCSYNNLSDLDINSPALLYLNCNNNKIRYLDLSNAVSLEELDCSTNYLESLDTNKNVNLVLLDCSNNDLTFFIPTKNVALKQLYCHHNSISTLTLGSNTKLVELDCSYNKLSSMDDNGLYMPRYFLTNAYVLEKFICGGNLFTELNIQTVAQGYINLKYFDASDSPKLKSVVIRGIVVYNSGYEELLESVHVEKCPLLETLECGYHENLKSLSVSECPSLTSLDCPWGSLTTLDVSDCTSLTSLRCWGHYLSTLDITPCSSLQLKNVHCGSQLNNDNTDRDITTNRKSITLYVTTAQKNGSSLVTTTPCFATSSKTNDLVTVKTK